MTLDFEQVCVCLEELGYRRHEIGKLSRRYIQRVLFGTERDENGQPKFLSRKADPDKVNPLDPYRAILFRRGFPRHVIEARVNALRSYLAGERPAG